MEFLEEIADLNPLPAGGAAAAYTANLGIALLYKVLIMEINRKGLDPAPQATLRIAQKEIERLHYALKKMTRDDPQCYLRFREALKSGDNERSKNAFGEVLTCSLEVIEKASDGLEWVRRLSKFSSLKLLPHLRISAELLAAGIAGTAHVARDNVKLIESPGDQQDYLDRLESVYELGMAKKKEILETL
ncbi:cyclodeaminase/cyclohydrolase family protein [Desulfomonile tiedjei]|uniref:Methenyl tetrahydrofolate cyclohydrolase n=1 Tax=Desulfomonile tiedjei (strain ATCC 49306 / DSM 6799 / DCB-1) TaxID=706587 RepID=I4C8C0_DESTA|nr:cyclodeaminase/cyclohydrolase family protein [Desulfomonile tiedjei]AFM25811.1 methenyl tetrahydrofolate cyclohydrolase [Desulfomonile tiedjei DSM 6799]